MSRIPFSGMMGNRSNRLGTYPSSMPPTRALSPDHLTLHQPWEREVPADHQGQERVTRILGLDLGQAVDPAAMALIRWHDYPVSFTGPRWPYMEVAVLKVWEIGYAYNEVIDDVLAYRTDAIVFDMGGVGRPFRDFLYKECKSRGHEGKLKPVNLAPSDARIRVHEDARGRYATVPKVEVVTAINILQQRRVLDSVCPNCSSQIDGYKRMGKVLSNPQGECQACKEAVDKGLPFAECRSFQLGDEVYKRLSDDALVCFQCAKALGKRDTKGCSLCSYLKIPASPAADRLFREMRTFVPKRTAAGREVLEHRGPDHHGDLVIAVGLACWFSMRGNLTLSMNTVTS